MQANRLLLAAIVATLLLLVAGCPAKQAYSRGQKALAAGKYDEAVAQFAKAVEKDSKKEEYRTALASAKVQAADWRLERARAALADRDLVAARTHAIKVVEYQPGRNGEVAPLLAQIDQAIAAAEARRQEALRLAAAGDFDAALAALREALALNRTLPGGQADLGRINRQGADSFNRIAAERLAADDWAAAEAAARKALTYVPADAAATAIVGQIADRRRADELVRSARLAMDRGQFDQALANLTEASRLHPQRPDLPGLMQQARQATCDQLLGQGRAQLAVDPAAAVRLFARSNAILPGYGGVDALLADARGRLANQHVQLGLAAGRDRRDGAALLHFLLADAYLPNSSPRGSIEGLQQTIRQRVVFSIAVNVDADPRDRRLANAVRDDLVNRLSAVGGGSARAFPAAAPQAPANIPPAPPYVPGLDNPPPLPQPPAAPAVVDSDARLDVAIQDVRADTTQAQSFEVAPVQVGVRRAPNDDFGRAAAYRDQCAARADKLRDEGADLQRERRRLTDLPSTPQREQKLRAIDKSIQKNRDQANDARDRLRDAVERLRRIPEFIEEPVIGNFPFPVYSISRVATATLALAMTGSHGEVLARRAVRGQVAATDRTIAPDPAHGIEGDPLQLPPDGELINAAVADAVAQVVALVQPVVAGRADAALRAGDEAARAGRPDAAIECYVDFLFMQPASDPRTAAALAALDKLVPHAADMVSLSNQLRARCGVPR